MINVLQPGRSSASFYTRERNLTGFDCESRVELSVYCCKPSSDKYTGTDKAYNFFEYILLNSAPVVMIDRHPIATHKTDND